MVDRATTRKIMKKIFYMTLCFAGCLIAQQKTTINSVIERKDYQTGYQLLAALADKTWADWYNLGCCAYETRQFDVACRAWAIAYYGAKHSGDSKIASCAYNNKKIVERDWGCCCSMPLDLMVFDWLDFFFGWLPAFIWQVLSLMLLSIVVSLWLLFRAKHRYIVKGLAALWIFSLIPVTSTYMLNSVSRACVVAASAKLHLGPQEGFQPRGLVQHGDWLMIIDSKQEWVLAKGSSAKGWIKKDAIICT
jgi:hypothetical protein